MSYIAHNEIKQEQERKQRTNAQRYREQLATDEGLAEFLMKAHDNEIYIPFCKNEDPCEWPEGCQACMRQWLRKPYEGD